ncbi:MAG TPA: outer membrane beta-barrel protein [Lentimicrobium sp.]|nr:outer membrane beta-barrel protein [Lentimicrobium sp.]
MHRVKITRLSFVLMVLLTFCSSAFAQYSLTGIIKDKKTNETIPGANILIKGTTTGAISDLEGRFVISNLRKGSYIVIISYISYKTIELDNVRVGEHTSELDIQLEESVASLEGVTVTASRQTNTEISIVSSIKIAEVVVSGISAQQISKSQDKDASEVVKRIPGVTVVGNKFIRIRGLAERYNNVLLNQSPAPSMEADIRSFSFDIVPSSLIDRILIFKSPSADLPGDFSGGTVKIFTRSIPEESFYEAGYTAGYRQGSSLTRFKGQENSFITNLGFNDRKHDLPQDFPDDLRRVNPQQLTDAGRALPNDWVPQTSNAGLNHNFNLTGGLKLKAGKVSIGNVTSLLYSSNRSIRSIERYDYMEYDKLNDRSTMLFSFIDREYNYNIRTGILHNWAFRFNQNHTIEVKNFFNQLSQQQYILRTGIHYDFNYVPENHSFDQVYRGIYNGQLNGTHKFLKDQLIIDWVAGYNTSYRNQPDYRRYRSDVDTIEGTRTLYIPLGSASAYFLGRFFSAMNEHSTSGSINITYKPQFTNNRFKPTFKAGFILEKKQRDFWARNIGYVRTTQSDPGLENLTIDKLFQPENINNTSGMRIDEQSNTADSYTASNLLNAAFVMISLSAENKINFNAGVRLEDNRQQLGNKALFTDINNNTIDLLPSANVSYNFNDKSLLRAAYGLTVNRPEFRELAPFGFYDFSFNLVKKGNKDLKNATIHNIDLRWEYYPTPSELFTAGVFYKKFIDPIETQFVPGGGSGGIKDFSFANVESAQSMGVEAEVRRSLAGLTASDFISDLTIIFNGALIKSRVNLDSSLVRQSVNRPMQGQSPYILNLGIYYRNLKNDLQVSVLYNVTGRYIYSIGFDVYPDVYQMPRNVLDFSITKGLGSHFVLKVGISDILNDDDVLLQDANGDGKFESNGDQVIQRYSPGSLFNLGIVWKTTK